MEKKKEILIIDDVPQNLAVLGKTLRSDGYKIIIAGAGEAGIYAARNQMPSLILLDVHMPKMDGFEVCQKLKQDRVTQDIPIIFLTADDDKQNVITGLKLGAVDYITKPFERKEVLARVKTHIHQNEISKEKELENLELAKDLRHEKDVNEYITNLLSMLTHDLKNPLTVISTSAALLSDERVTLPDKKQKYNHNIQSSIKQIDELIERILFFSTTNAREITPVFEECDIIQLCNTIIADFQFIYGENRIEFHTLTEKLMVKIDKTIFSHILSNLVSNAIKYSAAETVVRCYLEHDSQNWQFSVVDQGIGIPKKEIAKLFNDYYRGSNVAKNSGMGVGLSIVRKIIDLHHGSIEVESELNKGSIFRIICPMPMSLS